MRKIKEAKVDTELYQTRNEMRQKEMSRKHSKIQVPYTGHTNSMSSTAWREAANKVIDGIGSDLVWKVTVHTNGGDIHWSDGWDYQADYNETFYIYAFNETDALDRLSTIGLTQTNSGDSFSSYIQSIEQIDKTVAQNDLSTHKPSFGGLKYDHILCLPTTVMHEEMKRSIDWAAKVLQRMKDQDEAALKQKWLETQDGKDWIALFDKEQQLLQKIERKNQSIERAAETRRANEEQKDRNAQEVEKCFNKQSTDNQQYNIGGIVPVVINNGIGKAGSPGNGFVVSIYEASGSFSFHYGRHGSRIPDESTWTKATIYVPGENNNQGTTTSVNIRYCKLDTSITPQRCSIVLTQYMNEKFESTLSWCRGKDPNKSDIELRRWTINILKKHLPHLDFSNIAGDLGDVNGDKVRSTVQWAISLGHRQQKTNRIISAALAKKHINPNDYREIIGQLLSDKFGFCDFRFE